MRFGSFMVKMLSYPVCILQTGRVQAYALFVVVGVAGVLRLLRDALTLWTSIYSVIVLFTPLAGLRCCC